MLEMYLRRAVFVLAGLVVLVNIGLLIGITFGWISDPQLVELVR